MRKHSRTTAVSAALLLTIVSMAWAQGRGRRAPESFPNAEYDGRYVFARISYTERESFARRRGEPPWSHDYPRAERNFLKILDELSSVRVRTDASTIISLDNPEMFRFPVLYMAEAGFWSPSDVEVANLRAYVLKGGFVIFDDFSGAADWRNFEAQVQRVLPGARAIRLDTSHPIFDSFYRIVSLDQYHPVYGMPSEYFAIFENNDPTQRMLMMINYNNDIAEYWEFSDQGFFPIDLSNEAYKIGINYIIYALSR